MIKQINVHPTYATKFLLPKRKKYILLNIFLTPCTTIVLYYRDQ